MIPQRHGTPVHFPGNALAGHLFEVLSLGQLDFPVLGALDKEHKKLRISLAA